jgi:hypothetical protein
MSSTCTDGGEDRKINADAAKAMVDAVKDIPAWRASTYINKRWQFGRLNARLYWRRADGLMGRFGGGWDWKLGFQASTPSKYGWTIIFSLLVADFYVSWKPAK